MINTVSFQDLKSNLLSNSEVKAEYDALEEEFELANQIIELRQRAGLTQKELAEKIHTSQPAISRLESGNYKNVSMMFLRKVGNALGVKPHIQFEEINSRSI